MTTPAPHEPCCECCECLNCAALPRCFEAVISDVFSTTECQSCDDANELYGLGRIPCQNVACGWYTFEHCQRFDDSCGHVRLLELDIEWTIDQGVLITTLWLTLQFDSGGGYWQQVHRGHINCNGPFTFTSQDLAYSSTDCDFSEAVIELTGMDDSPCG